MNIWKIIISVSSLVGLGTLVKWLSDGRNILTKQQMVIEKTVRDEIFGTNIVKTEMIDGFWLGLDIAAPLIVTCLLLTAFSIWRMRKV